MSTNLLFDEINKLEEQLQNLNPHSVLNITLFSSTLGQLVSCMKLKQTAPPSKRYVLTLKLPFTDSPSQDGHQFEYQLRNRPNITITVKFKPQN